VAKRYAEETPLKHQDYVAHELPVKLIFRANIPLPFPNTFIV